MAVGEARSANGGAVQRLALDPSGFIGRVGTLVICIGDNMTSDGFYNNIPPSNRNYLRIGDRAWSIGSEPVPVLWETGWRVKLASPHWLRKRGFMILRYDR